jgi:hypothetical protein
LSAPAEGQMHSAPATGRFTIGITGRACIAWHVHLAAAEARQFVGYVDQQA